MTITILGTGAMGAGMAQSLRRDDLPVTVWNRTTAKAEPLAELGATVATDVAAAVAEAEVVISILYDADSTLATAAEFLPAMRPGAVWVQSATVGIEGTDRVIAAAAEHGVDLVDAPVLGSKGPAEQGKLVWLASGKPALAEKVRPAFEATGSRTMWVGDTAGAGSRLKLVTNAWIGMITAAAGQSVALAQALDLDPQLFLDAMAGGQADTPYLQLKGTSMITGDFTPAFSVDGVRKDQRLIRDALVGAGIAPDLMDGALAAFDAASSAGHGEEDMAAVLYGFGTDRQG